MRGFRAMSTDVQDAGSACLAVAASSEGGAEVMAARNSRPQQPFTDVRPPLTDTAVPAVISSRNFTLWMTRGERR